MKKSMLTLFLVVASVLITLAQDTFLDKGNLFLNNNQFDEAGKIFKEAIKSDSTNLIYQCQLGLTFIKAKKYLNAEEILSKVLNTDSNNVAAIWYSGIGNFYNRQDREAIDKFESALTLLDKNRAQYAAANWFIGKCYSNLLKTSGLTYKEADRMFECLEKYIQLQPDAADAAGMREYIDRKKKRRAPENVGVWIDL
jgi:tetratricopeptide (TPR) repeat protein